MQHHQHSSHNKPESESEHKAQLPDEKSFNNPTHGHSVHDHHAMMIEDFKKRFYVLTVPYLGLMANSDKEYMAGLRYIISMWFGVLTRHESDTGFKAGIPLTYNANFSQCTKDKKKYN